MHYFVYYVNTIALYWQEKSTLFINENRRIDNPRIKIVECVGAKAQDEKLCWKTTKTMGIISNIQILSYWLGPYFQKKSLKYKAKIGLWQIFQLSIFVLSRDKCLYQSHWIRNFRFFFPYFGFLSLLEKFERHCL